MQATLPHVFFFPGIDLLPMLLCRSSNSSLLVSNFLHNIVTYSQSDTWMVGWLL